MNAPISSGSLDQVCQGLGISKRRLLDSRLDLANDMAGVVEKMDRHFAKIEQRCAKPGDRLDSTKRRDGAAAFTTNALAVQLAPIEQPDLQQYLFVPGRAGPAGTLLPVRQTMPLGAQTVEWEVLGTTGEAVWTGPGGTKKLRRVGEASDKKEQPNGYYGVRYGWDEFDLWRDGLLPGRNLPMERARTARRKMDEFSERVGGEGSNERKIPGFFIHGNVTTLTLAKSFGDPTITAEEMWDQLAIMDLAWFRLNPNRAPSGIVMPRTHRLRLAQLFKDDGSGVNAWEFAVKIYPWLTNIVQDDRMLTMSAAGGPMWQMWSAGPDILWRETTAAPMLFGPFLDELETDFILLAQDGGVVSRDHRTILRLNQPA